MNDIMKITKSLGESSLLIKSVSKTIKNEAKEQKGGFLRMLLGTLGASLLGGTLGASLLGSINRQRSDSNESRTRYN